jgi:hypothetical protein
LCGEVHPLYVHGYPQRRYRDPGTGENVRIRVVSVICPHARAAGKQYTLRLLPDFLIPCCVIRLDRVVEAVAQDPSGTDIEETCRLLGCIDERTARSHLKRMNRAIETAVVHLAERRAMAPELGELPETTPDEGSLARLMALYRNETEAAQRAGGDITVISLGHILQAALWKPGSKKPSAFAVSGPRSP